MEPPDRDANNQRRVHAMTRPQVVRSVIVMSVACVMSGCAADVVLTNPRTGETVTCTERLRGLDPWSQKEACVGKHIAEGWIRAE